MLISQETSKALDLLYNKFFDLNSLFDNAVSYMLNVWCMPNASETIHINLAHTFPLMADKISEIKDNYDERSIRTALVAHDEEFENLSDMMELLYENCANAYELIKATFGIAMEHNDVNVVCDLADFQRDFNKIIGQIYTLKNKADQMPVEYDKFDRHIDKWGIVGLGA